MTESQMSDKMITLDQVKTAAEEVVRENPLAKNPALPTGGCAYTKQPGDESDAAEHCLGGTILLHLGLKLPSEGAIVRNSPDADKLYNDAMSYLRHLQFAADGFNGNTRVEIAGSPRSWSDAKNLADEKWEDGSWRTIA